ncbi:unnamed protein product [marine sediment metagenome]|uniref:Uncharacterized protein n=1 Tax=marine sediment metagenome TaxID=412755 RepID=X0UXP1_9ZZZZ
MFKLKELSENMSEGKILEISYYNLNVLLIENERLRDTIVGLEEKKKKKREEFELDPDPFSVDFGEEE